MNSLKIKVCGMCDGENIRRLARLNPDLMGFIFYPASPRYAGEIPAERLFESFPPGIIKTGVFVDSEPDTIKTQIINFGLQAVQLHGNESPEICRQLMSAGVQVIKAFSIDDSTDFSKMIDYVSYSKWFLFDTATNIPGGSGKSFNWKMLNKYHLGHPFFLSGGIGQEDAGHILSLKHEALAGVDINSKFETEPGVKDVEMVKRFIQKLRSEKSI
jgi:phosphoribosylanthranilate isomerase